MKKTDYIIIGVVAALSLTFLAWVFIGLYFDVINVLEEL